jgi:MYND finger
MSEKYTYKDMEESMVPLKDPELHKRFLATFQRQRGYPKPSAESKTVVYISMNIYHKGNLLEEKSWKLPQGAVSIMLEDKLFRLRLFGAWEAKQGRPYGLTRPPKLLCDACGDQSKRHASGYLDFPVVKYNIARKSLVVDVNLYFVCGETSCGMFANEMRRLEMKKCKRVDPKYDENLAVPCAGCPKVEPQSGPKFFVCSKCKVAFYCSRECQLQDWKKGGHKQECKENYRRKLKKEKAQAKPNPA